MRHTYNSTGFVFLLSIFTLSFLLSCSVYFKSEHNVTKEGKTIIKKPQQVIISSPFDSSNMSIAAGNEWAINPTYQNLKRNDYFDQQIKLLFQIEGGYQNDSRDLSNLSGRGTKYGITAETALRFGDFDHLPTSRHMLALTEAQAKRIYFKYYQYYKLDKINNSRLAWLVFDGMVNMPSRVPQLIKYGLNNQGIDSDLGSRWNQSWVDLVNEADPHVLFDDFWEARYTYYEHRVGRLDSNSVYFTYLDSLWSPRFQDSLYLNGWLNRMAHLKERL